MTRFTGDHRFPPGRPPLDNSLSRPDQTAALNKAFAAWGNRETNDSPTNSTDSLEAIRRVVDGAHAAAGTMRPEREPFLEIEPASEKCDPASFLDPEHIVCSVALMEGLPAWELQV
jgi:hypothetical protein